MWSDEGYIGTVGDGTTSDIIKSYVEKQGNQEEKEAYQQMKIFDYWYHYNQSGGANIPRCLHGVRQRNFDLSEQEQIRQPG